MKLSRRVAQYVTRPRGVSASDAEQDAAVILLSMRERWNAEKSAHLDDDRQERLIIAWARLRLIDHYESSFREQQRTFNMTDVRQGTPLEELPWPRLSDLDREDIAALVAKLPERQRAVVRALLYEGKTQVEAAHELGVTQTAVCRLYERARETLRDLLADFDHDSRVS